MLKIIGVDVDKYRVTNYADEFCEELRYVLRGMNFSYGERTDYYNGFGYRKRKKDYR
jgi:hypothetical protein